MCNTNHPKFPCQICAKNVHDKDKAVQCDLCELWIHIKCKNLNYFILFPETLNTGLVSSRASLTSGGEGASLALIGHPSSDGVMTKMPNGVHVLH